MIRPLIGGGSSECKASDENVGKRRCKHLLCACSSNSLRVIDIIQNNGGEAYLVGGCVRDMILREKPHDEDLTTSLTPDQVTEIFEKEGYKVIPTGLQHGTVTVMVDGEGYEITTFRKDGDYSDGRHPDSVEFSTDVNDDCSRRDFTFNAMYYDGKEIIDTYGGQKDIENKVIRTVGDPDARFNEDALRMLRAVRFSSKLGFEIDPKVQKSINKNKELIRNISAERIQSEITKTLLGPNRRYAFDVMRKTGILKEVLPELDALKSVKQNPKYHIEDAYEHSMSVVDSAPDDARLRYAALFHDLGKATTQQKDEDGTLHFIGHEKSSAKIADNICRRLKMSTDDREEIVRLVKNHNCPASAKIGSSAKFIASHQDMSDEEVRKLQILWKADWVSHTPFSEQQVEAFNKFNERIDSILSSPHRLKDIAINGDDLVKRGYQGKKIRERLEQTLYYVMVTNEHLKDNGFEQQINTKKNLMNNIKRWEAEEKNAEKRKKNK